MASNPPATDGSATAGAEPSPSGGRWPGTVGRAAFVLAVIATVLFAIDLATRPPCPENYVRLIDVEVLLPVVTGVFSPLAASPSTECPAGQACSGWPDWSAVVCSPSPCSPSELNPADG